MLVKTIRVRGVPTLGEVSIPQLREAHLSIVYNQFTIRTCVKLGITLLPLPE
jgi:hypothetical protein